VQEVQLKRTGLIYRCFEVQGFYRVVEQYSLNE